MTHLTGSWTIDGSHRLFDPLVDLLLITSCLVRAWKARSIRKIDYEPGAVAVIDSLQFDRAVHLPLVGALECLMSNIQPIGLELKFVSKDPPLREFTETNIQPILTNMIAPIFITFFEDYRAWYRANVEGDMSKWPSPWSFGRVIRNAMSHRGVLNIYNSNGPTVAWHHLSYSPQDTGKRVLGTELNFTDILMLMIEMSDDLDQRGCPISPP